MCRGKKNYDNPTESQIQGLDLYWCEDCKNWHRLPLVVRELLSKTIDELYIMLADECDKIVDEV